jgi:hypothetical protein
VLDPWLGTPQRKLKEGRVQPDLGFAHAPGRANRSWTYRDLSVTPNRRDTLRAETGAETETGAGAETETGAETGSRDRDRCETANCLAPPSHPPSEGAVASADDSRRRSAAGGCQPERGRLDDGPRPAAYAAAKNRRRDRSRDRSGPSTTTA